MKKKDRIYWAGYNDKGVFIPYDKYERVAVFTRKYIAKRIFDDVRPVKIVEVKK